MGTIEIFDVATWLIVNSVFSLIQDRNVKQCVTRYIATFVLYTIIILNI